MGSRKAERFQKIVVDAGNSSITLRGSSKLSESWRIISHRLDTFEAAHLMNLLEAAVDEGKKMGLLQANREMLLLQKQFGKQIEAIGRPVSTTAKKRRKKRKQRKKDSAA